MGLSATPLRLALAHVSKFHRKAKGQIAATLTTQRPQKRTLASWRGRQENKELLSSSSWVCGLGGPGGAGGVGGSQLEPAFFLRLSSSRKAAKIPISPLLNPSPKSSQSR